MSTKIYTACRFKVGKLTDFLNWYHDTTFPKVQKRFDTLIKMRLCNHTDVRVIAVFETKENNKNQVLGKCLECSLDNIPGLGIPSENVTPMEKFSMTEFMIMVRRSNDEILATDVVWNKVVVKNETKLDKFTTAMDVLEEAERASKQSERDTTYDLDCGVMITLYNGMFYAIPMGEYWTRPENREDKDETTIWPDFVEDYNYWNNSDPPSWAMDYIYDEKTGEEGNHGPGYRKWLEREKTWHDIFYEKEDDVKWLEYWVVKARRTSSSALLSPYMEEDK